MLKCSTTFTFSINVYTRELIIKNAPNSNLVKVLIIVDSLNYHISDVLIIANGSANDVLIIHDASGGWVHTSLTDNWNVLIIDISCI